MLISLCEMAEANLGLEHNENEAGSELKSVSARTHSYNTRTKQTHTIKVSRLIEEGGCCGRTRKMKL